MLTIPLCFSSRYMCRFSMAGGPSCTHANASFPNDSRNIIRLSSTWVPFSTITVYMGALPVCMPSALTRFLCSSRAERTRASKSSPTHMSSPRASYVRISAAIRVRSSVRRSALSSPHLEESRKLVHMPLRMGQISKLPKRLRCGSQPRALAAISLSSALIQSLAAEPCLCAAASPISPPESGRAERRGGGRAEGGGALESQG
mmetsp:Transcript_7612/g.18837  ORF Transcript_7612/g.18837 Transcript_7612/m.18837 type:complete len:203 (+) Transcript_7612:753-1361(+)